VTDGDQPNLRVLERPTGVDSPADRRAYHPSQVQRRRPALYISAEPADRVLFTRIARRWEAIKLLVAESGREGLQVAVDRRLRMIVLDARLPDVDSAALVTALRARAESREAPIIVLAHERSPSERARFIWAGARAYVAKPLDVAEIDRTVGMLLEVAAPRYRPT